MSEPNNPPKSVDEVIDTMDQQQRNQYYSGLAMKYGDLKYKQRIFGNEAANVFNEMQAFNKLVVDHPVKPAEAPKVVEAEVVQ